MAQGLCTAQEAQAHINALELKTVGLALKALLREAQHCHIHFHIDNTAAVAQINKMGDQLPKATNGCKGGVGILHPAQHLTAEHLPGILNVAADRASRVYKDASDWQLNQRVFAQLEQVLGKQQVDLFVSRHNAQKEEYVSWKRDPGAISFDAFALNWHKVKGYAFPPFYLVGRLLAKVRKDKARLTLVAPVWPNQQWYPVLLELLVEEPILLPPDKNLLSNPRGDTHPLIGEETLELVAWKVSGDPGDQMGFLSQLPSSTKGAGTMGLRSLTTQAGKGGLAGIKNSKLILFRPLWAT
ncbi:uncharacterized protein LOC135495267 [Lineus longissimus]|uniref:uncharacterized protein LOC135495267 n=1 Tax=Lineus longissimus TaxID=88925 RepID=UPI00315DB0E7